MWNRFNRSDQLIFAVAFVGLLAFSYLTAHESILFTSKEKVDAPVFGKLITANNDVRHKATKQFQWKPAKSSSQIHIGDSLFTGPDSKAQVEIAGGTRLDVGPNSMVFFDKSADKLTLNLEFGKIDGRLSGAGGMRLKVGTDLVDLSSNTGGEISLSKNSGMDGFEVEALSGEFNVKTNQNDNQLGSGKKLTVARTGEQLVENAKKEAALAEILRKKKAKEEAELKAQEEKLAALRAKTDFVWIRPTSEANFEIRLDENKKPVELPKVSLEWRGSPPPEQTVLEVSRDPAFANPVTATLPGNTWESAPLEEGQYYARLRNAASADHWSPPVSFTVSNGQPQQLAAPKLLTPEIKYQWPSSEPITVKWEKLAKAGNYRLQVASDISFTNIVLTDVKLAEAERQLPALGTGRFYFRVAGITRAGNIGANSRIGTLDIASDRPAMSTIESIDVLGTGPKDPPPPKDFALQWKSLGDGALYEVQVARKEDFSDANTLKTRSPASNVKLRQPGRYFTRVRALSAEGKPLSEFSDPRAFDYKYRIPLTSPELLEPARDFTLFYQRPEDVFFWLAWKPIRDNEIYEIEIARDKEFTQIILGQKTSEARLMIKSTPLEGDLFWRVRATSIKQISNWSEARALKVVTAKSRLPAKASGPSPDAPGGAAPAAPEKTVAPEKAAGPEKAPAAEKSSAPAKSNPAPDSLDLPPLASAPQTSAPAAPSPGAPSVSAPTKPTTAPATSAPAAAPAPPTTPAPAKAPPTTPVAPPKATPAAAPAAAPKSDPASSAASPAAVKPNPAPPTPSATAAATPLPAPTPSTPAAPVPPRRLVPDDE